MRKYERAGKRIFDVKLQGRTVLGAFNIAGEAGSSCKAYVQQFRTIAVSNNLEIELVEQDKKLSLKNSVPVLCGVEVLRERKTVHARQ